MNNRGRAALVSFVVTVVMGCYLGYARVAEAAPDSDIDKHDWYFALGMGQFRQESNFQLTSSKANYGKRAYFGYEFNRFLSAELGYIEFDSLKYGASSGNVTTVDTSGGHARALFSLPL